MKIGDRVYVHGYVDEIRKDTIIIRNAGGYFGTVKSEIIEPESLRHGKWTRKHNYGSWECSECGCKVNRTNPLKGNIWNYYYCPNCGARMDKDD